MSLRRIQIPPAAAAEGKRQWEETNIFRQDIAAEMGISPDTLRRRSIEWGWKRRARNRTRLRSAADAAGDPRRQYLFELPGSQPRVLAPKRSATGGAHRVCADALAGAGVRRGPYALPDTDKIEALSPDRAALWERVSKASFLSVNEKRLATGYGPAEVGDVFPPQ
jgi:hypothetical protein